MIDEEGTCTGDSEHGRRADRRRDASAESTSPAEPSGVSARTSRTAAVMQSRVGEKSPETRNVFLARDVETYVLFSTRLTRYNSKSLSHSSKVAPHSKNKSLNRPMT